MAQNKMLVIPAQFDAGGRIWDIQIVEPGKLFDSDGQPAHGLTDFDSATILLEENDSPRLMGQVFLHELSHVMFHVVGIYDHENEETHRLVDALGSALLSYMMTKKD